MRRFLLVIVLLHSVIVHCQDPQFAWAQVFEDSRGRDVKEALSGHVYTTGGNGTLNDRDCFIRKRNVNGELLWAFEAQNLTFGYSEGWSMHLDNDENVYVAGDFSGNIDFALGDEVVNADAGDTQDIFLVKYNTEGEFQSVLTVGGGVDATIEVRGMAVNSLNQFVLGGQFSGTVDFDPGDGEELRESEEGISSAFILILDESGNFIEVTTFNTDTDQGRFLRIDDLSIDEEDNIIVYGQFVGQVDFDPSSSEALIGNAGSIFLRSCLLKIDSDLNYQWVIWVDNSTSFVMRSIAVTLANEVLITGATPSEIELIRPDGTNEVLFDIDGLSNPGRLYFIKFSPDGDVLLSNIIEDNGSSTPSGISSDLFGDIYVTGSFEQSVDFDMGPGVAELTTIENDDRSIYCAKYDGQTGDYLFAFFVENSNLISSGEIALGATGNILMCGGRLGTNGSTMDFDPGPEDSNTSILVAGVSYIWKMDQCFTVTNQVEIIECDTYESPVTGEVYTSSIIFEDLYETTGGCDSLLTVDLTILESSTLSQEATACGSFTWNENGVEYTESGVYDMILQNSVGCDSTITLNLTIDEIFDITETQTACESFIWEVTSQTLTESNTYIEEFTSTQGCDSTRTLELTILEASGSEIEVFACDEYESPSGENNYTESGTYQDVILNAAGCDSLITIDLEIGLSTMGETITAEDCFSYTSPGGQDYTESGEFAEVFINAAGCDSIVPLIITINTVNASVIAIDNFLQAEEGDATYQWLDCNDDFSLIPDATEQGFQPLENGSYAVEVSNAFCTDTSVCAIIFDLSVVSNGFDQKIGLYPNPSEGEVFLSLEQPIHDAELRIYTITGELVQSYRGVLNTSSPIPFKTDLRGTLIIEIISEGNKAVLRATRL